MKKFGRRGNFSGDTHTNANDDSSEYKDAYSDLSKSVLVHDSKIFNDKQLKEKKCIDLLNKVIFLLN